MKLKLSINADELAKELQASVEDTTERLKAGIQKLTIMTHAKVIEIATAKLDGYKLQAYMGDGGANIGWSKLGDGFYVVTLKAEASWLETGREKTDMATDEWLLKSAKTKTARDGSRYLRVPMPVAYKDKSSGPNAAINSLARQAIQSAKTPDGKRVSTMKLQRGPDGQPKVGLIQKIDVQPPFTQKQAPGLYSKPRDAAEAQATGLKQHQGIFRLKGLMLTQKKVGGRVVKEAIVMRTVSSKHVGFRWQYPKVEGIHALDKAFEWLRDIAYPEMVADLKRQK